MDLATKDSGLGKLLACTDYTSCRIDESMLHREFSRIIRCAPESRIDLTVQDYIQGKTDEVFEIVGVKRVERFTREQSLKLITNVSESIAELKLRAKVSKADVNRAIELIKEKIQ